MSAVRCSPGYRIEPLRRDHPRSAFHSGQAQVDDWLANKALQNQDKHLSATKVLIDPVGTIAGFYTLATAQVDFTDLPPELCRRLPRRNLPVAVLAWLGVRDSDQGQGHGRRLLVQALNDSFNAGQTFPFVAVILDCIDDQALTFYRRWDFRPLPGHNYRLFLSWSQLQAMATGC
ncbi:N-acetyltransferase [uncultured Lamprocystis sp.]|jgi:ribosomal protein S18 acetylase RimI-like enzyme|uniref:N-acetyltransferase n=1 Tax=uncultured Lamprocystis sp. TaxID=543132 RepID=UPI0025CD1CA8|nr:N-acetyltransferase [uncultured Lamprocystis sp.]